MGARRSDWYLHPIPPEEEATVERETEYFEKAQQFLTREAEHALPGNKHLRAMCDELLGKLSRYCYQEAVAGEAAVQRHLIDQADHHLEHLLRDRWPWMEFSGLRVWPDPHARSAWWREHGDVYGEAA